MIDVIIPTYCRYLVLKRVLPYYLAQEGVCSVILVEDGPLSPEIAELGQEEGGNAPKVVTIATGRQSGAPAAKKYGLQHATSEFVAFGEDDVFPAPGYYATLAAHVREGFVDVVAGADYYLATIDEDWQTGIISHIENYPFFGFSHELRGLLFGSATSARYLGRRSILLRYPPDPGYAGNGWREETDPQLSMWGDDLKIATDPTAICFHLPRSYQQGGGQHARSRLTYEYWCLHNDVRFFRKHRESLKRLGFRGPALSFALSQFAGRWRDKLAARLTPDAPPRPVTLPRLESEA